MLNGIDRLRAIRHELVDWLRQHEYTSIRQLQGSMSQRHAAFPAAFERTHHVRAVSRVTP
jgi:dihydroorotate dehydrogenase (fumarate)